MSRSRLLCLLPFLLAAAFLLGFVPPCGLAQDHAEAVKRYLATLFKEQRGICVLLGDAGRMAPYLAQKSELTIFVQSADSQEVADWRQKADQAGLLGTRIYVHKGDYHRLHLAENLADHIIVGKSAATVAKDELLRILRPGAKAMGGTADLVKPMPEGTGEWNHPYHGADNNPQSTDQVARRPFMTHFLAEPWYCPLTQITVVSGGRMFKAFGERSSAIPQEAMINKLIAMSPYNGTILWQRDLAPGFMIHRNTIVATPTTLYLADNKSCQLIDAATGKVRDEIVVPPALSDGPVWKWMALEKDVLYALVGAEEPTEVPYRGTRIRGAGWPWWPYKDYKYGFGRTLLAFDVASKKVLWNHREQEPIDGRALCLKNDRLYFYSDGKFLACLDAKTGQVLWKNADAELLEAIGTTGPAQHWMKGFASTAYMKAGDGVLFFAGPQRPNIVGVSAKDGKVLWKHKGGNVGLVLRQDGLYALGEGTVNKVPSSLKIEPQTGKILATFPSRDRCTRATGNADSIFTRGGRGGSTAVFDVTSEEPKMRTLAPMRPACTDGVVVAHGLLFWGPWMCACDQTQIGVISLGPAGSFDFAMKATNEERLERAADPTAIVTGPRLTDEDWLTYRKDNACSVVTSHAIPSAVGKAWEYQPPHRIIATAPTAAGGLIFVSGSDGIVRALDAGTGKPRWTAYTGGPVKYPPAIWGSRAYVGSGDGWVYCLETASGRLLWRFRAAPVERIMPVYGSLASTWPISSGVLVDKGTVYAAAGIFNYDGTHVYALDAQTGQIRWQNNNSGLTDQEGPGAGVSVQGHLLLYKDAIYVPAGNKPTVASYAVADGKFTPLEQGRGKHLFVRNNQVRATGFPLYWRPEDDHFLTPLELETPAGVFAVNTGQIARLGPQANPKKPLWGANPFHENAAVAFGKNAVLVSGVNRDKQGAVTESAVCALDLATGKLLWKEPLPAPPVAWGLALDRTGRIIVTLFDGRVVAVEGRKGQ